MAAKTTTSNPPARACSVGRRPFFFTGRSTPRRRVAQLRQLALSGSARIQAQPPLYGRLRQSSLPHCPGPHPQLEGHRPGDGRTSQHKRETAPGLANHWRHGDIIYFCASTSCSIAGACTPFWDHIRRLQSFPASQPTACPGRLDHRLLEHGDRRALHGLPRPVPAEEAR